MPTPPPAQRFEVDIPAVVTLTAPLAAHTAVQGANTVYTYPAAPPPQVPTIGRIVLYTLSEQDADAINRRRDDARNHLREHQDRADGSQIHFGNQAHAGDVFPMVITRVWGDTPDSAVNGQVMLDGNDTLWASSVQLGEGERHFAWPPRV